MAGILNENDDNKEMHDQMCMQSDHSIRIAVQSFMMVAKAKSKGNEWVREQIIRRVDRAIENFTEDLENI